MMAFSVYLQDGGLVEVIAESEVTVEQFRKHFGRFKLGTPRFVSFRDAPPSQSEVDAAKKSHRFIYHTH